MSAIQALVSRMLSYEGNFDGYPSMFCSDEGLIHAALQEQSREAPTDAVPESMSFMCYLASENATTREQYENCRNFIEDALHAAWVCNMSEGSNPVHAEIEAEEEQVYNEAQ
jgi:NADPH-dependent 7-cyano-7-deazaguanine reductase QueF-like protein